MMTVLKVEINKKEYEIPKDVFDLIYKTSVERDYYRKEHWFSELRRLIYEQDWHISMFDDVETSKRTDGHFVELYEQGLTTQEVLYKLELEGY